MGGWNSGGGRDAPREDHFLRLDLSRLKALGFLRPHWRQSLIWTRGGRKEGDIVIESYPDHLMLIYRTRRNGGEWRSVCERVSLAFTEPHYGGRRIWMLCPGCGARKRTLWGSERFLCRACHGGVTYESQYADRMERKLTRIQSLRRKLGGEISLAWPFPERPKRMRLATYERMKEEEARLREELDRLTIEKFGWSL